MEWLIWTSVGIYAVGFVFFFAVEALSGPVTPALSLLRATVWPVYWATGWPHGVHARMD